ncbi:MAG: nucleotidyltransferase domain-containing protein [Tomitella sp.]|nr:nucleotidyltransferase domain-containing protein [Tomitella sp.]
MFGSYARGDQGPDSDLDILIEMDPRRSGWDLAGLLVELADLVPVEVDATTRISRHFEEFIEPELVPIL